MAKRYEMIAADLRQGIQSGDFSPDTRLPAETALASNYEVGLPTVRQALGVLQAEGLIEKRHGRGNFVRGPRRRIEYISDRHPRSGDSADVTASVHEIEASGALAARFGVCVGSKLVECVYRGRHADGGPPYSVVRSYVLRDAVEARPPVVGASPWGDAHRDWLAHAGVEVERVVERVTARPPTAGEAEELGITPGVAVLAVERTSFDIQGTVVEAADLVMSGDRVAAVYARVLAREPSR